LQSVLIDLNIPYEVQGDGSFDLRNPEHVQEILNEWEEHVGPLKRILYDFCNPK